MTVSSSPCVCCKSCHQTSGGRRAVLVPQLIQNIKSVSPGTTTITTSVFIEKESKSYYSLISQISLDKINSPESMLTSTIMLYTVIVLSFQKISLLPFPGFQTELWTDIE